METNANPNAGNILELNLPSPRNRDLRTEKPRFKIITYENRTGTKSYRVAGSKRDGTRIRENFAEIEAAQCRQVELQMEYLARATETAVRATKLTDTQLRLSESCFLRLDADHEISLAVDYWLRHGKQHSVKHTVKLDEAFDQFKTWLNQLKHGGEDYMRDHTRRNLIIRVNVFANSIPNLSVADITPDLIADFLSKRNVSPATRDNDRRALSRFFAWCMERPRRWIATNPARAEKRRLRGDKAPPQILTIEQCEALLRSAINHKDGLLAPYVALALFAGLRPFELQRLTCPQINLSDKQISLTSDQSKTKRNRVVKIQPTLAAWLKRYKDKPITGMNWRRDFDAVKLAAGFGGRVSNAKTIPWTVDVLRHTAISHFFRDSGSYGLTAEQFDNSEAIIKRHYQNQTNATTKHTKRFYKLTPAAIEKGTK